jgi:uncharacterized protein DUF6378
MTERDFLPGPRFSDPQVGNENRGTLGLGAGQPRGAERGVLNERETTHGDFVENSKIMQALKQTMRTHWGWEKLTTEQREALEMIQHKIGRILCGNNNYFDHWRDIAGYAKLVEERCPKP